jgi:peptide/nickel transport system substrate-binding protein
MAPTDDIHIRKALAWAMDYQTVITEIMPGSDQAVGPVMAGIPGWNPNVFQYHYDLDKARQELALSKYANNLSQYEISFVWCAEAAFEEKTVQLFAAACEELGIPLDVQKTPWMTMIANQAKLETAPNIAYFLVAGNYPEAGSILEARYASTAAGTWEQNEWLQNATIDAMLRDAFSTVDNTERYQKYQEIQEQIVNMCPTIFLFYWAQPRAYQEYYIDWPAAKIGGHVVAGYDLDARWISVYPEKRDELL